MLIMAEKEQIQDSRSPFFGFTGFIIELFLSLLWMKAAFKYYLLTL